MLSVTHSPSVPSEVAEAALETVLKPLGTSLRHYEARHKEACLTAMSGILTATQERARIEERERAAKIIDAMHDAMVAVKPGTPAEQRAGAIMLELSREIARAIRNGGTE